MSGLSLGTRLPNLKFVPLAILELFASNAPKFTGSRNHTPPTFQKYLSGVMSGLSLGTRLQNLKFVASAVLQQTDRQSDKPVGDWFAR